MGWNKGSGAVIVGRLCHNPKMGKVDSAGRTISRVRDREEQTKQCKQREIAGWGEAGRWRLRVHLALFRDFDRPTAKTAAIAYPT
jgi:hypothetical protein